MRSGFLWCPLQKIAWLLTQWPLIKEMHGPCWSLFYTATGRVTFPYYYTACDLSGRGPSRTVKQVCFSLEDVQGQTMAPSPHPRNWASVTPCPGTRKFIFRSGRQCGGGGGVWILVQTFNHGLSEQEDMPVCLLRADLSVRKRPGKQLTNVRCSSRAPCAGGFRLRSSGMSAKLFFLVGSSEVHRGSLFTWSLSPTCFCSPPPQRLAHQPDVVCFVCFSITSHHLLTKFCVKFSVKCLGKREPQWGKCLHDIWQ